MAPLNHRILQIRDVFIVRIKSESENVLSGMSAQSACETDFFCDKIYVCVGNSNGNHFILKKGGRKQIFRNFSKFYRPLDILDAWFQNFYQTTEMSKMTVTFSKNHLSVMNF